MKRVLFVVLLGIALKVSAENKVYTVRGKTYTEKEMDAMYSLFCQKYVYFKGRCHSVTNQGLARLSGDVLQVLDKDNVLVEHGNDVCRVKIVEARKPVYDGDSFAGSGLELKEPFEYVSVDGVKKTVRSFVECTLTYDQFVQLWLSDVELPDLSSAYYRPGTAAKQAPVKAGRIFGPLRPGRKL